MPRPLLPLLLCAAFFLPAPFARGQSPDFVSSLSGTTHPLTIKVKDLDVSWRQMSVAKSTGMDLFTLFALGSRAQGPKLDLYYTHGETTIAGGETFLVAYRSLPSAAQLAALTGGDAPQPAAPITPDTVLSLSLVNVRQIGSLDGIQAYTPLTQAEIQAQTAQEAEAASLSNLKQLSIAFTQYTQDNDEKLPPMQSAAATHKAIFPFVKNDEVFQSPVTHEPYLPNTSLSGRSIATFNSPSEMVIYYEPNPAPDGTRAVAFLDGHVKRIPESQWPALKAASHVPNVPPR